MKPQIYPVEIYEKPLLAPKKKEQNISDPAIPLKAEFV